MKWEVGIVYCAKKERYKAGILAGNIFIHSPIPTSFFPVEKKCKQKGVGMGLCMIMLPVIYPCLVPLLFGTVPSLHHTSFLYLHSISDCQL